MTTINIKITSIATILGKKYTYNNTYVSVQLSYYYTYAFTSRAATDFKKDQNVILKNICTNVTTWVKFYLSTNYRLYQQI